MTSRVRRSPGRGTIPSSSPWRGKSPPHIVFYVLLAFLLACLLGGGSNRTDVYSLLYLRPFTVICLFSMLFVPVHRDWRQVRAPLVLLGLLAVVIAIQLVPLPPSIWARLPGRAPLAGAMVALGGEQPWRPLSWTPDLTLNSLLALLAPLTVLVGYAGIRPDQRAALVPLVIGAAVASAALGIIQFTGGRFSPANLYAGHSLDVPNGWFANRNHHADFLACALVLIATWLQLPAHLRRTERQRYWIAGLVACFLFVVVIATGSRSGTLLTVLALAYAGVTTLKSFSRKLDGRNILILWAGAGIVALLLIGIMLMAGRAVSLDRLFGFDATAEQRIRSLPTLIAMWRDFMPIGSGFGSFDPVFRMYEPDALLHPGYFNHAHNDWLELGLTGGLAALVILVLFVLWVSVRLILSFRLPGSSAVHCARGGGIVLLVLGAASISDYPLRTPLLAAFTAIACAWLSSSFDKPASPAPGQGSR